MVFQLFGFGKPKVRMYRTFLWGTISHSEGLSSLGSSISVLKTRTLLTGRVSASAPGVKVGLTCIL